MRESAQWVDNLLQQQGINRTGEIYYLKSWALSTVATFESDQGPMCLKRVPDFFAHEGSVLQSLAAIAPDIVPDIVVARDDWTLMRRLAQPPSTYASNSYSLLGRLQVRSLSALQAFESMAIDEWTAESLVDYLGDTCTTVTDIDRCVIAELQAGLSKLRRAWLEARFDTLPRVIIHGDLNAGNVMWDGASRRIIDWTDACIGSPVLDLAVPAWENPTLWERLRQSFLSAWEPFASPGQLQRQLDYALSYAAGLQVATHIRILSHVGDAEGIPQDLGLWVRRTLATATQGASGAPT